MILKEFEALLHLFIVFNFAYAISNKFTEVLNDKISEAFAYVKSELNSLINKVDLAHDTIIKIQPKKDDIIDSSDRLESIRIKLNDFQESLKGLEERISNDIKEASITTKSFGYICFYAGLYGLTLLIVSGFCNDACHAALKDSLFIFNLLSLSFTIYCIFYERRNAGFVELSFIRTIIFFCCSLGISALFYLLFSKISSEKCWFGGLTMTTMSLFISGYHFVFYAFIGLINSYRMGAGMKSHIKTFSTEFDAFKDGEYSDLITFHKQYDKLQIKNKKL